MDIIEKYKMRITPEIRAALRKFRRIYDTMIEWDSPHADDWLNRKQVKAEEIAGQLGVTKNDLDSYEKGVVSFIEALINTL